MRIWIVSALEFLFPLVFDGYERRSNPLLLIHVNSRCVNVPLVRSAVWMICSLISNEIKNFYEDVEFNSIMKWRLGIEEMRDENLHNFLAGEEFSAEISLSRSALWLLAAALGAEELVVNSLSYSIPSDNSAEESIALFCSENTIGPVDISRILSQTSNVTLSVFRKYERNFKKRLQQFCLNGGEESKRIIYEGLSHLSSISLLTNSIDLPSDYSHLPDDSVLRAVIEQFCAKSACNRVILHDMLLVLVDHVRSDGRHLPPLDLKIVLSAIDYRNNHEARLNMLRFAIQERDQQVMYELTEPGYLDDSANVSPYLLSISQNLPLFLSFLPNNRAVMVLKRLLKFAIQDDDVGKQILVNIDECGQQQSPTDLLHKVTSLKAIDKRFKQQVSRCFDFWLACSGRIDSELSGLVEMFVEESAKSDIMLCIFGYCSMSLTLKERLDKLVDLMSFGKVMLSKRDSVGKIDTQSLLFARWRYHWKKLSNICQFCELFDMVGRQLKLIVFYMTNRLNRYDALHFYLTAYVDQTSPGK
uniref:Rod_C domain-containing protein n=1 Tax=Angiostrongylus cantonensis TaxID=6313 RepID=A0A0K0DGU5_ANGCA